MVQAKKAVGDFSEKERNANMKLNLVSVMARLYTLRVRDRDNQHLEQAEFHLRKALGHIEKYEDE